MRIIKNADMPNVKFDVYVIDGVMEVWDHSYSIDKHPLRIQIANAEEMETLWRGGVWPFTSIYCLLAYSEALPLYSEIIFRRKC